MTAIWPAWLITFAVSFALLEGYALLFHGQTLTHWVRAATLSWPWMPYLFAAAVVVLAVHFWVER